MWSSKWTARMKVERTERHVSRGYTSVGLGGARKPIRVKIPEILESWRVLCWRLPLFGKWKWLGNQRCISFLYEGRFKVTSSSRHAHWIKDVDNLNILIEGVRFDQDITNSSVVYVSFYVNLSKDAVLSRGVQHQWFNITKSAHSDSMWEKSERDTWEQKTIWDRSDRSSRSVWPVRVQRLVYLNRPVWGTGLTLMEQRLVFERGVFIPHISPFRGCWCHYIP